MKEGFWETCLGVAGVQYHSVLYSVKDGRLKKIDTGGGESAKTWCSRVLRQDGEVTTTGGAKGREEGQG